MEQDYQIKKLREFICEKLNCRDDELTNDTDLKDYDGYNSIFVVEFIMFIEESFDIEIPDDYYGLDNYKTIGTIVNLIDHVKVQPTTVA